MVYLLAAHAISECDTVTYKLGIGKSTVLKTFVKGFMFAKRGDVNTVLSEIVVEATLFFGEGYDNRVKSTMSEIR